MSSSPLLWGLINTQSWNWKDLIIFTGVVKVGVGCLVISLIVVLPNELGMTMPICLLSETCFRRLIEANCAALTRWHSSVCLCSCPDFNEAKRLKCLLLSSLFINSCWITSCCSAYASHSFCHALLLHIVSIHSLYGFIAHSSGATVLYVWYRSIIVLSCYNWNTFSYILSKV